MRPNQKKNLSPANIIVIAAGISAFLSVIKLVGFFYTGSLIVLASFFDSLTDTATSIINKVIYQKSIETADKEHPFGHGGFEVIGALIQGLLICFFSASILVESIRKLWTGTYHSIDPGSLPIAVAVMLFSGLGGLCIHIFISIQVKKLKKKRERSLILLADKAHYSGDMLTNFLSACGLMIVYFSKLQFLDPLMGGLSALFLGSLAVPILKKSFKDIAHNEAPEEFQQLIVNIVMSVDKRIKGIHLLRSRELGPYLFVDFHMKLPDKITLIEAHAIDERVEAKIKKVFPNADIFIHLDPESEPDQKYWDPAYTIP
jgi:ferrous-iron efflux pump FieF